MSDDTKVAWRVNEWSEATGVCRSTVYTLLTEGKINSVCVGRRRLITTRPADFIGAQPAAPGLRWAGAEN